MLVRAEVPVTFFRWLEGGRVVRFGGGEGLFWLAGMKRVYFLRLKGGG